MNPKGDQSSLFFDFPFVLSTLRCVHHSQRYLEYVGVTFRTHFCTHTPCFVKLFPDDQPLHVQPLLDLAHFQAPHRYLAFLSAWMVLFTSSRPPPTSTRGFSPVAQPVSRPSQERIRSTSLWTESRSTRHGTLCHTLHGTASPMPPH